MSDSSTWRSRADQREPSIVGARATHAAAGHVAASAVPGECRSGECELEFLWRSFHSTWVHASEALADARDRQVERERSGAAHDVDRALERMLQTRERFCFAALERFQRRLNDLRRRSSAFRVGR